MTTTSTTSTTPPGSPPKERPCGKESLPPSSMLEGQTQTMALDDVDARAFGLFNHWLYAQEIEDQDFSVLIARANPNTDETDDEDEPTTVSIYFPLPSSGSSANASSFPTSKIPQWLGSFNSSNIRTSFLPANLPISLAMGRDVRC